MKNTPTILDEKCTHCKQIGNWQVMMSEIICAECMKPYERQKPYALYILGAWIAFWMGLYFIHLMTV
jgi:hypothetical protein